MTAKVIVTGNLGATPELRYTPQNKAVLDVSIGATLRQHNKQTDQWNDVGEPLWLRTSFWEEEAQRLADVLQKGDRVTVEGTLTLQSWTGRDGQAGQSLELRGPRFLGVVPRRQTNTQGQAPQPAGGFNNTVSGYDSAPAGGQDGDPWAQQGAMDAPF